MMDNKVLFCATVDFHFNAFHLPYMKWFKEQGWEVHVAAQGNMDLPFVDKKYDLPISRSPFSLKNKGAFNELKGIIDINGYKIIHCHTPVGGVLARLAASKARKKGTSVIYTAHGFHFCKGSPLLNWIIYYPIEKILARKTDCLVTINEEDYKRAVRRGFKAKQIKHIHGVGVNTDHFKPASSLEKKEIRKALGYQTTDFIMFYAAEFNKNKNQLLLIEALAKIKHDVPHARLLLAGDGGLLAQCKQLATKLGVEKMVDFLGYRNDIEKLLKMADIAVASSHREGLPVNILEAMACGLPVIASENRGHRELICNNKNGWLIEKGNASEFANKMMFMARDLQLRSKLGENGRKIIVQKYSIKKILEEKSALYKSFMNEMEGAVWASL